MLGLGGTLCDVYHKDTEFNNSGTPPYYHPVITLPFFCGTNKSPHILLLVPSTYFLYKITSLIRPVKLPGEEQCRQTI